MTITKSHPNQPIIQMDPVVIVATKAPLTTAELEWEQKKAAIKAAIMAIGEKALKPASYSLCAAIPLAGIVVALNRKETPVQETTPPSQEPVLLRQTGSILPETGMFLKVIGGLTVAVIGAGITYVVLKPSVKTCYNISKAKRAHIEALKFKEEAKKSATIVKDAPYNKALITALENTKTARNNVNRTNQVALTADKSVRESWFLPSCLYKYARKITSTISSDFTTLAQDTNEIYENAVDKAWDKRQAWEKLAIAV